MDENCRSIRPSNSVHRDIRSRWLAYTGGYNISRAYIETAVMKCPLKVMQGQICAFLNSSSGLRKLNFLGKQKILEERRLSTDNASAVESVLQLYNLFLVFLSVCRQTFDATSQHADLRLEVAQLRVLLIDLVPNVRHRLCRLLQPIPHTTTGHVTDHEV